MSLSKQLSYYPFDYNDSMQNDYYGYSGATYFTDILQSLALLLRLEIVIWVSIRASIDMLCYQISIVVFLRYLLCLIILTNADLIMSCGSTIDYFRIITHKLYSVMLV